MTAAIGILAAGGSTRMRGRDKLLEDVDGEPLLARVFRTAGGLGATVLVALPAGTGPRHALAALTDAVRVPVEDPARGMSASISVLAAEADRRQAEALLLLLADMPEIERDDLRAILSEAARHPSAIVRAGTADGRAGHPVVFPRAFFDGLRRLTGDTGGRGLIQAAPEVRIVPLAGERAFVDLDTPEAWEAWREARRTRHN